jgi:hypothetical protein
MTGTERTLPSTEQLHISRPVMNSPADEAEARDRVHAAPRQADSDAPCRGMAGALTESETRPVIATERRLILCPYCSYPCFPRDYITTCPGCRNPFRVKP